MEPGSDSGRGKICLLLIPLNGQDEVNAGGSKTKWRLEPTATFGTKGYSWDDSEQNNKQTGSSRSWFSSCLPTFL